MKIAEFAVEQWMNEYEFDCEHNLAETCVRALTLGELLEISGRGQEFLTELADMQMTYGHIPGSPRLRELVAGTYETKTAEDVVLTHGAIGANMLVHQSLVGPGDHVVSVVPAYQQHVSIPESFGAELDIISLQEENGWALDLDDLESRVRADTKLVVLTNPNNPTGALIERGELERLVSIARKVGAWILCDEVYRGVDQHGDGFTASIADLYERGVSTGSMSKPYSLAGLRLGWIVGPAELLREVNTHRDYSTISVSRIDDALAVLALENREAILARSREFTRGNLEILDAWVEGRSDVSYVKPASGTTALIRYSAEVGSAEFCRRLLEETGVLFTPGAAFDVENTVRIGFADDRETLRRGLALTGEFLDSLG